MVRSDLIAAIPCSSSKDVRWGISSTGNISTQFVQAILSCPEAGIFSAVASRSLPKAKQFVQNSLNTANKSDRNLSDIHTFGSYDELAQCPNVDVIYIGSPHSHHFEQAMLYLTAGKHVLCEKALTINSTQAIELQKIAKKKSLFFMEAMWTRFLPLITEEIIPRIANGDIGEILSVSASFGFAAMHHCATHRLFDPKLGGGALLDIGIYPLSFAFMILGPEPPTHISSVCVKGSTGVDIENSFSLKFASNTTASLSSSFRACTHREAIIIGSKGFIRVHYPFWHPTKMTIVKAVDFDAEDECIGTDPPGNWAPVNTEEIQCAFTGNGMQFEAIEVARCIAAKRTSSNIMPMSESISLMQTMDEMRKQWDLRYAADQ